MNKILYNEDYVNGMRFLLKKAKEQDLDIIRKCQWIPNVSKMLSEHDLCYKFWYNVWKQNKLHNVLLCKTWYDVMYDSRSWLFSWAFTEEGIIFWNNHLWKMLGLDECVNFFDYHEKLQGMRL